MPTYPLIGTTAIQVDGSMDQGVSPDAVPCYIGLQDSSIRFRATCTSFSVHMRPDNTKVRLAVDGKEDGSNGSTRNSLQLPDSAVWSNAVTFAGLDGATEREYRVTFCGLPDNHDALSYVDAITVSGGDINPAPLGALPMIAWYGASTTWALLRYVDSALGFAHIVSRNLRYGARNLGVASSTVVENPAFASQPQHPQGGWAGEARTGVVIGLNPKPSLVIVNYGWNDAQNIGRGPTDPPITAAMFEASYLNMGTLLAAGLPATRLIFAGMQPTWKQPAAGNNPAFDAIIRAVVATLERRYPTRQIEYMDISRSTNSVEDTYDGVHLYGQGYARWAARIQGYLTGTPIRFPSFRGLFAMPFGGLAAQAGHPAFGRSTRARVTDTISGARAVVSGA